LGGTGEDQQHQQKHQPEYRGVEHCNLGASSPVVTVLGAVQTSPAVRVSPTITCVLAVVTLSNAQNALKYTKSLARFMQQHYSGV
jgi:hypothetical protein